MLYNNIDMGRHMKIIEVRGRGLTDLELTTIRASGSDADYVSYRNRPQRYLEIDYQVMAGNKGDLRKKIDEISGFIVTNKEIPIVFSDEPERTYFGEYAGAQENREYHHVGIHRGTIFILRNKDKYGPEQTEELPDIALIENKGTAPADPIFELTAKKKSTFAMVSLGADGDSEYNLIGRPADMDEQVVDEKTPIFDELGDTLNAWDIPVTDSVGSFSSDSNGIFVNSYGTGSEWHGPALMREIDPVEDFEIEFFVRVRTESARQTFRMSTNFYDENDNELGMMRLWNKSTNQINKVVEARVGPYVGQFENYLISSRNYNWIGQRVYNGIIRVTRKGNVYTFYAAHITQRGNHIESITERYVDSANEYAGKLKFIQIDASIFGDTPSPNALSIPRVRVTERNQVLVDETPYILYPGDIVTLDHKDDDLLINGEPRNDLKNFGGSFFKLDKGFNSLVVTPADTFDTSVTFRDKYL